MTNQEQSRALRAAILSLQSGLLTILEFLEILADQSTDPNKYKRHITAIRESIQQLEELPPLTSEQNQQDDTDIDD